MVQGEISEDCLYLNVWSPAAVGDENRPVLVYIHGGGFVEGSGSVALYDGTNLARKGLVVVTINYRLGILGFFAHPELSAESGKNASGNYGLLDQIAALEWVQSNIAHFGGDPDRVTIAGQSAGAMSVSLLLMSPLADGLFHRAIIQSGPGGLASFGIQSMQGLARKLSEVEEDGLAFASSRDARSLAEMRAMSAEELIKPSGNEPSVRFGPVIDEWVLHDDVASPFAAGRQRDIPLLSGMNADESSAFPGYGQLAPEEFQSRATARYGAMAETFLSLYPAGESTAEAGRAMIMSARDFALTALRRLADQRNETATTNQYLYYFERAIPWPEHPQFGAFHSGELPYVFDNLHLLPRPWESIDRNLAEITSSLWANFVASGDPNGAELPTWPVYDASQPRIMVLGERAEAATLPEMEKAAFFGEYLEKRLDSGAAADDTD